MSLELINPFEEIVVIGKRYPIAVPPQSSTVIRALLPTGRHVSHANKLGHWSGPATGGRATRLERYTGGHGGRKKGVHVGKSYASRHSYPKGFGIAQLKPTGRIPLWQGAAGGAAVGGATAAIAAHQKKRKKNAHVGKSVVRGLEQLGKVPKVTKVPAAPKNYLGGARPEAAPDAKKPSMFSLKTGSGKLIAGSGATLGSTGIAGYSLGRKESASKALGGGMPVKTPLKPVRSPAPMAVKAPLAVKAPTSSLNSNMPAGARIGKRVR